MDGFREHFLDKYFAYRSRYVAYVRTNAPERAKRATASEVARLSFTLGTSLLFVLILGLLTIGAYGRSGLTLWPIVFALLTLACVLFCVLCVRGIAAALADRI